MSFRVPVAVAAALLGSVSGLHAQQPAPPPAGQEVVDRVVAVVGDTVLLLSDVQTELQRRQAGGQPIPQDPFAREALAREIVDARVRDLVLVEAAREAGIGVADSEVASDVDQDVAQVQQRFGSEDALRRALAESNLSLEQYRANLTRQYRDRLLTQRLFQQRLATLSRPAISDAELAGAWETQRASLGQRPATVSFDQVIVEAQPSDSAKAAARAEAEDVLRQLGEGGDFEVLARRFSDDKASGERGGDLGWFRQGQMVRPFENAVFAMRPGQTSGLVESEFGFHIIRLEKVRSGERQARHILIRPELSEADRARARTRADSVAAAVRGGAQIGPLGETYGTPADVRSPDRVPADRLPPAYAGAFEGAANGSIVGPFEVPSTTGPDGAAWAVARIEARQPAGAYTLEDVRDQLRTRLQEQRMIEQLVADLRETMFVEIQL